VPLFGDGCGFVAHELNVTGYPAGWPTHLYMECIIPRSLSTCSHINLML
jgi:hypothetical protein